MRRFRPLLYLLLLALTACGTPTQPNQPGASDARLPVTVLAAGLNGLSAIPLPTGQVTDIQTPSPVIALAQGTDGHTILVTAAPAQPVAGNLVLAALSWQQTDGSVRLLSLDFGTPHQGSMFTGDGYSELQGIVGTVGRGPFALNAFHGGGIGEIFAVLGANFAPQANYELPAQLQPAGLVVEDNMSGPPCEPQVLALSPTSQDFLVRGTLAVGEVRSCRYFTLSPASQLTPLTALTRFAAGHPLLAAAVSVSGRLALLTTQGQVALAASITAPPQIVASLQLSTSALAYPYLAPANLFWSPHAGRLVATAAGRLALYQVSSTTLRSLTEISLPANTQSVLAVFAPAFHLPSPLALTGAAKAAATAGQALEVTIAGPSNSPPTVRLSLTAPGHNTCIPLTAWVGATTGPPLPVGQDSGDGCATPPAPPWFDTGLGFFLVPPGAHTASSPQLRAATAHAWLVMPEAGWLETGTYRIQLSLDGRQVERTVTIGP